MIKIISWLAFDRLVYFRVIVSLVVGLLFLSSQSYAQIEYPAFPTTGWYHGCLSGSTCGLSVPPSGNDALEQWAVIWPGHPDVVLIPTACSYVGQRLALSCTETSCHGGLNCSRDFSCYGEDVLVVRDSVRICVSSDKLPDKNTGCTINGVGNPCNVATGNKYQSEKDFSGNSLSFTRSYNSTTLGDLGLGRGWRHNFQKALIVNGDELIYVSSSGKGEKWVKFDNNWSGDEDSKVSIVDSAFGFDVIKPNSSTETYSASGKLLSETDRNGQQILYSYNDSGHLETVTDHYGQSISFTYNQGYLNAVIDTLGAVYQYNYSDGNLISVKYPDQTSEDNTDNPLRIYHYDHLNFPHHLTGITDANGDRYATYSYDSTGKAISTEHAVTTNNVGQEKVELDYQGAN